MCQPAFSVKLGSRILLSPHLRKGGCQSLSDGGIPYLLKQFSGHPEDFSQGGGWRGGGHLTCWMVFGLESVQILEIFGHFLGNTLILFKSFYLLLSVFGLDLLTLLLLEGLLFSEPLGFNISLLSKPLSRKFGITEKGST